MKRRAIVTLAAILTTACAGGDAPDRGTANKAASNMVYSKDDRSGLCFGSITSQSYAGYYVVSTTHVPCTPQVEAMIQK